jgi:hypothetical protein
MHAFLLIFGELETAVYSLFCYAKGGASPPAAWALPRELICS